MINTNQIRSLLILITILYTTTIQAQQNNKQLHKLFDDYYAERMQLFPSEATTAGFHQYDDRLAIEGSIPYLAATGTFYKKYLRKLKKFDNTTLNTGDRISCDILTYTLQSALEAISLHLEYMPMNQFISTPLELASFGS